MRAAVIALRGVIHGRIHRDFLDGICGRRREGLANRSIDGCAGLNGPTRAEILSSVQDESILADLAGKVSIKQIVRTGAVQGEAVAGVAISVGENGLIAKARVRAGAAQEIRMNAGTENCQLREATSAQRRLFDGELVDYVAVGGVRLVHQWCACHDDRGTDFADLQGTVHGDGAIALDRDLRVLLGLEAITRNCDAIRADWKVHDAEGAVCLSTDGLLQARGYVADLYGRFGNHASGAVCNRSVDRAESLLRVTGCVDQQERTEKHE